MAIDPRNPDFSLDTVCSGFKILRQKAVDSMRLVFHELEHTSTGCRMIHLSSDDSNNVFIVTFRTLPVDSTGVAHILEHSVLESSRKYPVKIYKNLSGRSLNTFLNAMTSSDYTAYPFASQNETDYYNLMDVYLDATFFPRLKRETFLQEGWRYEFEEMEDQESPLTYKGVVYNEMKGALSNPIRQFHESMKEVLFPDLVYRHNSGGNPDVIPQLTYQQWKSFHERHYHPSNAYIFTYGNLPMKRTLELLDSKVMKEFGRVQPPPPTPPQPDYPEPIRVTKMFPVSETDETDGKSFVCLLWKLASSDAFYENLKLSLLDTILAGTSSSILNRTLLGSGLGGGLAPMRFEDSFRESIMGSGLKDTDPDHTVKIEDTVLGVLQNVAENGVPREEIEAAVHQLEFYTREIKGDRGVPFGLSLAMRGIGAWLNNGDFLDSLQTETYLERLREDALKPGFFDTLIQKYFLQNPHRVTLILTPEKGGNERLERALREKLAAHGNQLTSAEKQAIIQDSLMLKSHQDKVEDISCLPKIDLKDISLEPLEVDESVIDAGGRTAYVHDVYTNGISYLDLMVPVPFKPVCGSLVEPMLKLLTELGAGGRDYVEMGRKIKLYTGGFSFRTHIFDHIPTDSYRAVQMLSGKCLPRNHHRFTDILADLLLAPDFSDTKRISELLNMQKAYALPSASFNAHRMAGQAAGRHISPLISHSHYADGLGYIQNLLGFQSGDLPTLMQDTASELRSILTGGPVSISYTGNPADMDDLLGFLIPKFKEFPGPKPSPHTPETCPETQYEPEAWIINTDVSYVARVVPAVGIAHPDSAALLVLSQLMEIPLYDRIRAKGGAYGAFASFNATARTFSLMTYRDPHTAQSLTSFDAVIQDLYSGKFSDERLEQAIIETIRQLDIPPSPREKGLTALFRTLREQTPAMRRQHRTAVLATNRRDIQRVVETYLINHVKQAIAVVTSDEMLMNPETRPLNLKRISLVG